MLRYSIFSIALAGLLTIAMTAFSGSNCAIGGKLTDQSSNDPIPFATVSLYQNDTVLISSTVTDIDGNYCFQGIPAGNYSLKSSLPGYQRVELKKIKFDGTAGVLASMKMKSEGKELQEVTVVSQDAAKELAPAPANISMNHANVTGYSRHKMCESYAPAFSLSSPDFNTEEYKNFNDNEFREVNKNALSTFSIDVDRASYSNVRRFITQGSLPPADAVRVEEMINYFSYAYPQPTGADPFSISTEYTDCPWNSKHRLIHIGIQGKEIKMESSPANNFVFLIDVSGSMESPDKLPLLKSGLNLLIDQLRPEDHVSMVVYAGAAGIVLPSTSGNKKEKMRDALEQLQAGGSTAGGQGIELAYKVARENFMSKGNNRVILCTDGDFNVGVSSEGELVRLIEKKREDGIFLTVLGFGSGNYKDSRMEQLADKGNGNYSYIDNILEAKKTLVKEMGGTLLTIAKDVKIQIEFNPAFVKAYRLVGYENRVLANEDFNDDKKDAGELGSGHTVTAMYEIIPADSKEETASVDALKYQASSLTTAASGNEVMTIKFRYKEPKENSSKLITKVLTDNSVSFERSSENVRFSCAVASFGMLLRDSKFKGDADYKHVLAMAKSAKGNDEEGYRAEFIRLVEMAEMLKK